MKRSEKLCAENGALKTKLSEAADAGAAAAAEAPVTGAARERDTRREQGTGFRSSKGSAEAGLLTAGVPVTASEEERLRKLVLNATREHHQKELRGKAGHGGGERCSRGGSCWLGDEEEQGVLADGSSIAGSDLSSIVRAELATAFANSRGVKLGSPEKVYASARGESSSRKAGASSSTIGSPGCREKDAGLQGLIDSSSYEGQLLESVLSNWPANSRISRVVKQLMADVGPQAKATTSTCSKSSSGHNAVSAKEQLRNS